MSPLLEVTRGRGWLLLRGLIAEQPDEGLFFLDTGDAAKGERGRGVGGCVCVMWGGVHPPPRCVPAVFPGGD